MVAGRLETVHERVMHDGDDHLWKVREARVVGDVPGALADSCLIFDSDMVCRRLWHFPQDWLELDDVALTELMERQRG